MYHFTFLLRGYKSYNFSTSNFYILFFDDSHYNLKCEAISHCVMIYIFLIISNVDLISTYQLTTCISYFCFCCLCFKCHVQKIKTVMRIFSCFLLLYGFKSYVQIFNPWIYCYMWCKNRVQFHFYCVQGPVQYATSVQLFNANKLNIAGYITFKRKRMDYYGENMNFYKSLWRVEGQTIYGISHNKWGQETGSLFINISIGVGRTLQPQKDLTVSSNGAIPVQMKVDMASPRTMTLFSIMKLK